MADLFVAFPLLSALSTPQLTLLRSQIDVHFSLPRDADLAKRCDREKGQVSSCISHLLCER